VIKKGLARLGLELQAPLKAPANELAPHHTG
jgi:hypothetical protein